MLDQLRAMGVFACVVEKSSFSGAARELGITTSAVSQQIRSLEQDIDAVLLYRSTRRLSLTEAGTAFFQSCQEMLAAAERGKVRINELRDDLVGDLRIATTPELAASHVVPALSQWLLAHRGLNVHFEADNRMVDLFEERIDIAIRMCPHLESTHQLNVTAMAEVEQVLVASPAYLAQFNGINHPDDLKQLQYIPVSLMHHNHQFQFTHSLSGEQITLDIKTRLQSNNVFVAKSLCLQGLGLTRMLYSDVETELANGTLVEVLPKWKLPSYNLYAVTNKRDVQPNKIVRCLEALQQAFENMPSKRKLKKAS